MITEHAKHIFRISIDTVRYISDSSLLVYIKHCITIEKRTKKFKADL